MKQVEVFVKDLERVVNQRSGPFRQQASRLSLSRTLPRFRIMDAGRQSGAGCSQEQVFYRRKHLARYIGSVCKLCRRENTKLFLKAERCYTDKCAITRRSYPPGSMDRGG